MSFILHGRKYNIIEIGVIELLDSVIATLLKGTWSWPFPIGGPGLVSSNFTPHIVFQNQFLRQFNNIFGLTFFIENSMSS